MTDFARLVLDADTRGLKRGERDLNNFSKTAGGTAGSVDKSTGAMGAAFKRLGGVLAAAFTVTEFVRIADTFTSMNAQLRLVTASTAELADVQERLFQISQNNRVGFESTVELYARIARSTESLGASQEDILRVTDTINKALVISGTSAQQASGALLQLGQAFASGALRGDELNSILEGMPRVAKAIADGMGITVGQLRAMGEQGLLTSEEVFNALLKMSQGIDQEFGRMPATVGQAFTVLGNSVLNLVGKFDEGAGASGSLAEAIMALANAMDGAAGSVKSFGEAVGGTIQWVKDITTAVGDMTSGFASLGNIDASSFFVNVRRQIATTFPTLTAMVGMLDRLANRGRSERVLGEVGLGSGGSMKSLGDIIGQAGMKAERAVVPMRSFGGEVAKAGGQARTASDDFQRLYDRLFPFQAASKQFAVEMAIIQKSRLSDAEKEEAIARLERQAFESRTRGLGPAFVSNNLLNADPLIDVSETARKVIGDLEKDAKTKTVTIAESFAQMSQRITSSLQGLANSIQSGNFLGILGGVLDIFMQLGSSGVFGSGLQGRLNTPIAGARANGGQVNAGRSYLVGERGPELFTPQGHGRIHSNDNSGSRVHVTVGVDPASGNITAFVNNQIAATAPAIASAGAAMAQGQMAQRAQRRVR